MKRQGKDKYDTPYTFPLFFALFPDQCSICSDNYITINKLTLSYIYALLIKCLFNANMQN